MQNTLVRQIMSADLRCCTPESTLQEAARLMVEGNCGAIPVVENQEDMKPVGIITDRDIACRAVAEGKDPNTKVSECMTGDLEYVPPDTSIAEATEIMKKHRVRRLLVADRGRLQGIVAQADLARSTGDRKTAEVVKKVSQPAG